MADKVATAINLLSEDAFTAGLSAGDRDSLSEFITEYFGSADTNSSDEEQEEEELGDDGMYGM